MLPAGVDVDVSGETGPIFVARLQSFGFIDEVLCLTFVLRFLPDLECRTILRLNGAIGEELIDFDEMAAVLIVFPDLLKGGVDPCLDRPVNVEHSSIFAELYDHFR